MASREATAWTSEGVGFILGDMLVGQAEQMPEIGTKLPTGLRAPGHRHLIGSSDRWP